MSPQQQQYRSPDGVRSAGPSSPPSDEEGQFFPSHVTSQGPSLSNPSSSQGVRDRKEGLASTISKTRFLVLMMMVIPLVLGSWVIMNSRLYDVSFVFDKDGRVKIKRKALSKLKSLPSASAPSASAPSASARLPAIQRTSGPPQVKVKASSHQGIRVSGGGMQRQPPRKKADTITTTTPPPPAKPVMQRGKRYATSTPKQLTTRLTPPVVPKPVAMSSSMKRYASPKSFGIKASNNRGFFDSIVLRRRRGSGIPPPFTPTMDTTTPSTTAPPTSRGKGLFRSIRLRRRPAAEKKVSKDSSKKPAAPRKMKADMKPLKKSPMTTKSLPSSEVVDVKKKQQAKSIKSQIAVVAKKPPSSGPRRGGLLGLFSGIRVKRPTGRPEPEPEVPVLEIRLRLRKRQKSKAPRGMMMRQPSIKKKRQEAAKIAKELALEEKKTAKEEALQAEKKKRQAAKIESFNQKRDKLDAAKFESTQRKEAKKDAALLKSKLRVEAKFDRAMRKQEAAANKVVVRTMQKKKPAVVATKKEQKKNSAPKMMGFWGSLLHRQPKRRPKKKTDMPPPVEMIKKSVAAKKQPPTRKFATPKSPPTPKQRTVAATPVKKQAVAAVAKTAPTASLQQRAAYASPPRRSVLGYLMDRLSSRKKKTKMITVPLVEKNAPENVLPELVRHFTSFLPEGDGIGRPRPRSLKEMIQAPDRGSSSSPMVATTAAPPKQSKRYTTIRIREKQAPSKKRPPAIRIRRVKRNR